MITLKHYKRMRPATQAKRSVGAGRGVERVPDIVNATSGEKALQRVQNGASVHLFITEFNTPGMNGLVAIREARQLQPCLRAILLTDFGGNMREI